MPGSGLSAYYLSVNRNKESLALDLATEPGAGSVRILARRADVLVESFPPGGLEKFGLALGSLREENPRLVTASITGFGPSGPDADAPGFDLLAQAGAGLMSVTGNAGGPATKVGVAVSDLFAGSFLAAGILSALLRRERTGEGGHVETDLFSATAAALVNVAQSSLSDGVRADAPRERPSPDRAVPGLLGVGRRVRARGGNGPAVRTAVRSGGAPRLEPRSGISEQRGEGPQPAASRGGARRASARRAAGDLARPPARGADPSGPVRGVLEALGSATAEALGCVVLAEGVAFVASPIRVTGEAPPLRFPPALDGDGPRIRAEFGLPG